jgi:hypothetical protein
MPKVQLHFCSDQTAWRFIIPALVDLPIFQFEWESCQSPSAYSKAAILLKNSFFCPALPGAEKHINAWFELYGLDALAARIDFTSWGDTGLNIPYRPLIGLPAAVNGFILDIQSRHPEQPLRGLLKSRGLLHPIDRERLRVYLMNCAQALELNISPLPKAPDYGFE